MHGFDGGPDISLMTSVASTRLELRKQMKTRVRKRMEERRFMTVRCGISKDLFVCL
jgi:hypothetical protein